MTSKVTITACPNKIVKVHILDYGREEIQTIYPEETCEFYIWYDREILGIREEDIE